MTGLKIDPREIQAMIDGVRLAIRPESPAEHPRDLIVGYYGVRRRFYFQMEFLGRKMGASPPWLNPKALGQWFYRARQMGLRKQPAPASLLARVQGTRPAAKPARHAGKNPDKSRQFDIHP